MALQFKKIHKKLVKVEFSAIICFSIQNLHFFFTIFILLFPHFFEKTLCLQFPAIFFEKKKKLQFPSLFAEILIYAVSRIFLHFIFVISRTF